MRSYELEHIARCVLIMQNEAAKWGQAVSDNAWRVMHPRWQLRDGSLLLYTKTPSDVEERQVHLQGDDNSLRNALDTLASSCMQ